MKPIHLFPLVNVPVVNGSEAAEPGQSHPQVLHKLEHLAASLARTFRTPCRIRPETFDVTFSLDANRHQCYSTSILQRMARAVDPDARVLGVTAGDLYVPVLTFVSAKRSSTATARWSRPRACMRSFTACRLAQTCCGNACSKRRRTNWATPSACATAPTGAA